MKINAFSLNSVNSAIKKLQKHRNNFENDMKNQVLELTKKGYDFMLSVVRKDTGELKNSITWEFDEAKQKGIIKIGADYAVFVEYSTGIVGANSPHPELQEVWQYDINSHGMAGWWYFDKKQNKLRWTRGQSANAFVYKTFKFLEKEAENGMVVRMNG